MAVTKCNCNSSHGRRFGSAPHPGDPPGPSRPGTLGPGQIHSPPIGEQQLPATRLMRAVRRCWAPAWGGRAFCPMRLAGGTPPGAQGAARGRGGAHRRRGGRRPGPRPRRGRRHFDLKPANVLFYRRGGAKVATCYFLFPLLGGPQARAPDSKPAVWRRVCYVGVFDQCSCHPVYVWAVVVWGLGWDGPPPAKRERARMLESGRLSGHPCPTGRISGPGLGRLRRAAATRRAPAPTARWTWPATPGSGWQIGMRRRLERCSRCVYAGSRNTTSPVRALS
jgi:hypothetical protein